MSILGSFSKDELSDEIEKLNEENAALRKRVEELERESKTFEDQAVFYQAGAEKAERERDDAARWRDEYAGREIKIKADLDTVLDWAESVGGPLKKRLSWDRNDQAERTLALLEERRVERG